MSDHQPEDHPGPGVSPKEEGAGDETGISDWEEQDLLTIDLAAQRLATEIEALRRQIEDGTVEIDLTDARVRLERLIEASERLSQRRP